MYIFFGKKDKRCMEIPNKWEKMSTFVNPNTIKNEVAADMGGQDHRQACSCMH